MSRRSIVMNLMLFTIETLKTSLVQDTIGLVSRSKVLASHVFRFVSLVWDGLYVQSRTYINTDQEAGVCATNPAKV